MRHLTLSEKINLRGLFRTKTTPLCIDLVKMDTQEVVRMWGICMGTYPITQHANLIHGYRQRESLS